MLLSPRVKASRISQQILKLDRKNRAQREAPKGEKRTARFRRKLQMELGSSSSSSTSRTNGAASSPQQELRLEDAPEAQVAENLAQASSPAVAPVDAPPALQNQVLDAAPRAVGPIPETPATSP